MADQIRNHTICAKQYITEKDYNEIDQLEKDCYSRDKTNLKLELDYKLNRTREMTDAVVGELNEFLYYIDDSLVAYLGISSFGGCNLGEINGMTHPDYRRKGIFKKLLELAIEECKKRDFDKVLLLSDGNSNSGVKFIASTGSEYDFSEYRMKTIDKIQQFTEGPVKLRRAEFSDRREISRQNAIYFNLPEDTEWSLEEEDDLNKCIYMVEINNRVIGKIKISYSEHSAFISGFGILPEYRGKGYGKAALREGLRLINDKEIYQVELDVESKNNKALDLYQACGFQQQTVMTYYQYQLR